MKRSRTAIALLLATISLSAAAYFTSHRGRDIPANSVVHVEQGPIETYISVTGNVISAKEVTLVSPVSAYLHSVDVREGQVVSKGDILSRFDEAEAEAKVRKLRDMLRLAKANANEARLNADRARALYEVGGEARARVDEANRQADSSFSEVRALEADLALASREQEKYRLVAPTKGVITTLSARDGVWVKASDQLMKLASVDQREIEIRLDAGDIPSAKIGKSVTVSSDAYPGKVWEEKITWIAPSTHREGTTNTIAVRISLGSEAPTLFLGQHVDIRLTTARKENAQKILSSALILRQGATFLAALREGKVHFIPVETGIESLTHTELKTPIKQEETILLPQAKNLQEGESVRVTERGNP